MNKTTMIVLVCAIALVLLLGVAEAFILSGAGFEGDSHNKGEHKGDVKSLSGGMLYSKCFVSLANMAMAGALVYIYAGLYRKIKADFTLMLLVVNIALFVYALSSNPLLSMMFGYTQAVIGPFTFVPDICTFIALALMLRLSTK